jgi:tRNA pseudouridine13 synthase
VSGATDGAAAADGPRLLPGSANFQVIEDPAYAPSGAGEHLYVEIEKEGLTTDAVAEALARACGRRAMEVGYAGRKDRHAVTRQWFSVHFGDEAGLASLAERLPSGRVAVLQVARHANKLRLGHLAGNRFRLGLGGIADRDGLALRLAALARDGIRNRFGAQRFGVHGATLAIARAWGGGDLLRAVELVVDPGGAWRSGEPLPSGFRPGPEGRVLGLLRKGAEPAKALRAAGDDLRKLVASAGQSAVFNAVLDAREAAGLLHRLRPGDLGCNAKGAPFLLLPEEAEATNARSAPGVLDAFCTGPLPGTSRLKPGPEVEVEERAWSAATGIDWSWFADGAPLVSPGERRALVVPFRAPPVVSADGDTTWVEFALPSGSYATGVLEQVGVAIPVDRRG